MIGVLDYGMGNLGSVLNGIQRVGGRAKAVTESSQLASLDKLIVPGVGAFADAMRQLRQRGMIEPIQRHVAEDRPFLGICLGMQLLFETGYEDGRHSGLGILAGEVRRFDFSGLSEHLKIPHMGWNALQPLTAAPILNGIHSGSYVYFVHGYHAVPSEREVIATETEYGYRFASAVARSNLFATQFHPEKSQKIGLQILKNFAEL